MRHDKDNQWLDPLLDRQVRWEPAEFDFDQWARRYPEEALMLERGFEGSSRNRKTLTQPIWRCIMQSKVTRYSAAAVVALAAGLVLLNPLGQSRQGLLLAAQERIARVDTMVLRGQKVFSSAEDPNLSVALDVVKYISRQYGYAEQGYLNGAMLYRVVMNMPDRQGLIAFAPWKKKCLKYPYTEGQIKLTERLAPAGIVDLLLQTDHKDLGPGKINGADVEGFELHDIGDLKDVLPRSIFDIQQGRVTAWVSTSEHLPIQLEGYFRIGKTMATFFMDLNLHETTSLESYNVALDPGLFSTEIPEGYSEFKLTDIIPGQAGLANPASGG